MASNGPTDWTSLATTSWREAISKVLVPSKALKLDGVLGQWLPETQILWLWWYDSTSEELFIGKEPC
jgi:hypothetical protein